LHLPEQERLAISCLGRRLLVPLLQHPDCLAEFLVDKGRPLMLPNLLEPEQTEGACTTTLPLLLITILLALLKGLGLTKMTTLLHLAGGLRVTGLRVVEDLRRL
jgi:hypothetical protein